MTDAELTQLTYFRDGERDIYGKPLDWSQADIDTMKWLEHLRQKLDSPIKIIRLAHPGKPTAIDWCCPGKSYGEVVMTVLRLTGCSYGFYSGNSVHIDRRQCTDLQARWLAIKPNERYYLKERKIDGAEGNEANGWLYLAWTWKALQLVVDLAEQKSGSVPSGA